MGAVTTLTLDEFRALEATRDDGPRLGCGRSVERRRPLSH